MKRTGITILAAALLASCAQEDIARSGKGTLVLDLSRKNVPQAAHTRAVSSELAIQILTPDGSVYKEYAAGAAPDKVQLDANVVYTVKAYTPNQETWQTANDGRGEACYYGETTVTAIEDEVVYCKYQVPMANYAVTFTLPDHFDQLFTSYSLTLHTTDRDVTLRQAGTKAYFPVDGQGFTYQLQATNTDGAEFSSPTGTCTDVQNGRMYRVNYSYDFGRPSSSASIDISDETGDF